jgi:hypothetical protein
MDIEVKNGEACLKLSEDESADIRTLAKQDGVTDLEAFALYHRLQDDLERCLETYLDHRDRDTQKGLSEPSKATEAAWRRTQEARSRAHPASGEL